MFGSSLHSSRRLSTRRKLLAALGMVALVAGIVPAANAATEGPSLTGMDLDGLVVVSGKHFPESANVTVKATIEELNASGTATMKSGSTGRFLAAFSAPDGFTGTVAVTATSGDVSESTSVTLGDGSDEGAGSEPATTTTSAKPAGTTTTTKKPASTTTTAAPSGDDEGTTANNPSTGAGKAGFVTKDGSVLMLDGKPWKYVGYNAVHMISCIGSDNPRYVGDIDGYYKNNAAGMTDRVWALKGVDFNRLDQIVAAAKANNAKLIITLTDGAGNCDGKHDDAWYANWQSQIGDHVKQVVTRYKDDPTIAMWELSNEPRWDKNFFDSMGGYIRSLDPNHIISAGTMMNGNDAQVMQAGSSSGVDVLSLHEYDTNTKGASGHLNNILASAKANKKAIIIGEMGIDACSTGGCGGGTANNGCVSYTARGDYLQAKVNDYLSHPEVAGVNYWSYGQKAVYTNCDSYTGPWDAPMVSAMKAMVAKWGSN